MTRPRDLAARGRRLWSGVTAAHELDVEQVEMLVQACRLADRCDALALRVAAEGADSSAGRHERDSSMALARLLTALRLPDVKTGRAPQRRRLRGAQRPSSVSSLDRARARSGA